MGVTALIMRIGTLCDVPSEDWQFDRFMHFTCAGSPSFGWHTTFTAESNQSLFSATTWSERICLENSNYLIITQNIRWKCWQPYLLTSQASFTTSFRLCCLFWRSFIYSVRTSFFHSTVSLVFDILYRVYYREINEIRNCRFFVLMHITLHKIKMLGLELSFPENIIELLSGRFYLQNQNKPRYFAIILLKVSIYG